VVPLTAIDDLADKEKWWQTLGISRPYLIRLPSPEAKLQEEGLRRWTEDKLHRHHSLREKFVNLSEVFDHWLASDPHKRGQRIRVLWLQGEEGEHRHDALMSCLSGVARDQPIMYGAGMNPGLLEGALQQLLFSKSYPMPPLISVELNANEHRAAWTEVKNALVSAENHFADDHQAYPRLFVAGTGEQAWEAWKVLQERMEIKIIDTKGLEQPERPYSYHRVYDGMNSATLSGPTTCAMSLPKYSSLFSRVHARSTGIESRSERREVEG